MVSTRVIQFGSGLALFLVSAGALVLEIVAGRLLAPYVGMSLYTWTAIISVVLAGLSLGNWLGGRLAAATDQAGACRRVGAALVMAALSCLATLALLRVIAQPTLGLGWHPVAAIVMLTAILFLPPSLFAGIVSPILTKLAVDAAPGQSARIIGRMYALGAAGSILGTLSSGYLFISWIGTSRTVLAVAVLYGLLAAIFLGGRRRLATLAGVAALVLASSGNPEALASPCLTESDYYCIRVTDFSPESGRPSRVLVLDHLGHGINDRDEPGLLYSSYAHFADELARRRGGGAAPEAFFIGGGAYTLPRAWAAAWPKARLHVAEIDPAVTRTAETELWLTRSEAIRIDHRDARVALQSLPREPRFDVVFGDAFHDLGIPPHLVTAEFHREIAARLKPGGFYAINVIEHRFEPRFLFALIRTLMQDFAAVEVWTDGDDLAQGARLTYLVVASGTATDTGRVTSSRLLPRSWVRLRGDQVRAKVEAAKVPLLTDDFAPVDRLMAQVLLSPEIGER
jgi:MFS family permease